MLEQPELSNINQVSDGWIKKYILTYAMPDGSSYEYESVSRKTLTEYRRALEGGALNAATCVDAVCIVPQTTEGRLLLIREFRYPLNNWCLGFPAGLKENGESLADCVNRELLEETGYALRHELGATALQPLPQPGFSSAGFTDELLHVVFAQVEKVSEPHPGSAEFIEPFLLESNQIGHFLETNKLAIGMRTQLILELFRNDYRRRDIILFS